MLSWAIIQVMWIVQMFRWTLKTNCGYILLLNLKSSNLSPYSISITEEKNIQSSYFGHRFQEVFILLILKALTAALATYVGQNSECQTNNSEMLWLCRCLFEKTSYWLRSMNLQWNSILTMILKNSRVWHQDDSINHIAHCLKLY